MGFFGESNPPSPRSYYEAPPIFALKVQLAEAEKTLKFATEKTTENRRRRAEEEAQDHEFLAGHGRKIESIKEALDAAVRYEVHQHRCTLADQMKLKGPRARIFGQDFTDAIKRFEEGNLDYSIFKNAANVDYLAHAYKYTPRGPFSEPPKAEHISHVAALIRSGRCKKPSESSCWRKRSNDCNDDFECLEGGAGGPFLDPTSNSSISADQRGQPRLHVSMRRTHTGIAAYMADTPADGRSLDTSDVNFTDRQSSSPALGNGQCPLCGSGVLQSNASSESSSSTVYTPATTNAETCTDQ